MRPIRQLLAGEDEIQLAVRLALLALLIYWSFVVVRPFIPILAWSVVLAVALYPVFRWLSGLLGDRPKLAATVLTLINLGIVIGPATWLGLGAVEGLILATRAGIDPELAHEILRTSSGASRSLDAVAQSAMTRNFEPGFAADLMHKDVSLAVGLGRALGVRVLSGSLAEQVMQEARCAGLGKKSFTAPLLVQEKLAGVEVTRRAPNA